MAKLSIKGTIVATIFFILNAIDAFATHYVISNGLATELSPIMLLLINISWSAFFSVKIIIGAIAFLIFAFCWQDYKLARIGGTIALVIYSLLILYHIIGFLIFI